MLRGGERRLIDRVFPFHFAVDRQGRVVDAGPRLRELGGDRLDAIDFFSGRHVDAPYRITDHAALRREAGSINIVELPPLGGIRLRGEFIADPEDAAAPVRFVGHPWITSLPQMQTLGLRLDDFPPNSGLSDLLVMLQTRESVNADLQRMAADLRDRSKRLEDELETRRRLEAQLQHAQRMEAMGRLAGGIAHDFNNVLAAIGGHASLGAGSSTVEDAHRHFSAIAEAARRASGITARLLAFARRRPVDVADVEVDEALQEAARLLAPILGRDMTLEVEVAGDLPCIRTDATAFQQAIVNLVINARDASEPGGEIRITARVESDEATRRLRYGERQAGDWVVIEVEDDGVGMSEAILDHVFEPFFTTKDLGEGTGLGLATVWWVVERSGGVIDVRSDAGEGTRFSLHLPAVAAGADRPADEMSAFGDGRRLLVVEDDPLTMSAMVELLTADGFDVEWAVSAEEAIERIDRASEPFDVLLADVVLGEMPGTALAETVRIRQPWVRIVLMTAHDVASLADTTDETLLHKPFTIEELREAIGGRGD